MAVNTLRSLKVPAVDPLASDRTATANALVGHLLPMFLREVTEQVRRNLFLFVKFDIDDGIEWKGGRAEFPVDIRRDNSYFIARDDGTIYEGEHPEPVIGRVTETYHGANMIITDGAIASAGNRMTEVVGLIAHRMRNIERDFKENIGRELYLDGTCILAQVGSYAAGVITLGQGGNSISWDTAQYLYIDQPVQIYQNDRTTLRTNAYVTNISNAGAVTISGSKGGAAGVGLAAAPAANDVIVRRGGFDASQGTGARNGLLGLDAHVDDGTVTGGANHEAISETTYPEWTSLRLQAAGAAGSATTGPLSTLLFHRGLRGSKRRSGGETVDTVITSDGVAIEYSELFQPTMVTDGSGKVTAGFKTMRFASGAQTFDIEEDAACPPDRVWMLNKKYFKYLMKKKLGFRPPTLGERWQSSSGGGVFQASTDQLRYSAVMTMIGQLVCTKRNAHCQIENIRTQLAIDPLY